MTYNQAAHSGQVRIGNWFEELKLKEETGIRFYPSPTEKKNSLLTKARCIVHTDQVLPKDYTSVTRESSIVPQQHPEYRGPVRGPKPVGPRRMMIENTIKSEVEEEFNAKARSQFEEARKTDYTTLQKASFMKENFEASLKERDSNSRIPTRTAGYVTEAPITFYSHSYQTGKGADFPCTFVGSTNPFKRSSAFSLDPRKDLTATKAENNQRPRPLPTLQELRNLNEFRLRLLAAARISTVGANNTSYPDGSGVRAIIAAIWRGSTEASVHVSELADALDKAFEFRLTENEKNALLTAMDLTSEGYVPLPQLTNLIRPSPAPRRLELLEQVFGNLTRNLLQQDAIPYEVLCSLFGGPPFSKPLQTVLDAFNITDSNQGSIHVDDFFDYYVDISAEISPEEDVKFEQLLNQTWSSKK
mmetsp:Transcript_20721/g.29697  ORF Transcript_20721/g.29697 Transcript_20721/m.29697 type:complete len:416 (-) Transcript_20721:459-1706(-)